MSEVKDKVGQEAEEGARQNGDYKQRILGYIEEAEKHILGDARQEAARIVADAQTVADNIKKVAEQEAAEAREQAWEDSQVIIAYVCHLVMI